MERQAETVLTSFSAFVLSVSRQLILFWSGKRGEPELDQSSKLSPLRLLGVIRLSPLAASGERAGRG